MSGLEKWQKRFLNLLKKCLRDKQIGFCYNKGMAKKFYITSAIPYVNGRPHLGHTLEYVISDVINRYYRLSNYEVIFTCGSDENGQKILEAAKEEGLRPQELANRNTEAFLKHVRNLNVDFDVWRRATDKKLHWPGVYELWKRAEKKGDIYKKKYKGLYCVGCEAFYKKSELKDGKCPEHLKKPEEIEEENYFFRLSKYQDKLEKLIESDELKVFPGIRKNETLGFIRQGLEDFSVSRPKERLEGWGVPVPDDESQVMYVWFDALTIYMTAIGWNYDLKLWKKWWPADVHVIGKGIYRFHTVYWPAMLMSAGVPLPKAVLVHGYITSGGQKMAKSLRNVIDSEEILEKYGADAVRYYLLKEVPTQSDGDFTEARFKEVYNADLANGLGNLVARIITMAHKFTDGKVPEIDKDPEKHPIQKLEKSVWKDLDKLIKNYEFHKALNRIWELIHGVDKYIDENKPWKLAKQGKQKEIDWVVYGLLDGLKDLAWLVLPFLPETAVKIGEALQVPGLLKKQPLDKDSWVNVKPGTEIKKIKSLFPRLS
jgi:methionyl-tRNA synthetase